MRYRVTYTTKYNPVNPLITNAHRDYKYFDTEEERESWVAQTMKDNPRWKVLKLDDTREEEALIAAFKNSKITGVRRIDAEASYALGRDYPQ